MQISFSLFRSWRRTQGKLWIHKNARNTVIPKLLANVTKVSFWLERKHLLDYTYLLMPKQRLGSIWVWRAFYFYKLVSDSKYDGFDKLYSIPSLLQSSNLINSLKLDFVYVCLCVVCLSLCLSACLSIGLKLVYLFSAIFAEVIFHFEGCPTAELTFKGLSRSKITRIYFCLAVKWLLSGDQCINLC